MSNIIIVVVALFLCSGLFIGNHYYLKKKSLKKQYPKSVYEVKMNIVQDVEAMVYNGTSLVEVVEFIQEEKIKTRLNHLFPRYKVGSAHTDPETGKTEFMIRKYEPDYNSRVWRSVQEGEAIVKYTYNGELNLDVMSYEKFKTFFQVKEVENVKK